MIKKYRDNHRIHCYKCGRFIGKDGFIDIGYDDYMGGYEEGYSMCASCLKREEEQKNKYEDKLIIKRINGNSVRA